MLRAKYVNASFVVAFVLTVLPPLRAVAEDARQALFEKVFGDAVRLDPGLVEQVRSGRPGERLLIDRDGDGKHDEAWYIDEAVRHTAKHRPILVRAIDEDGDLDVYGDPDLDSDLYIADWKADGQVDVVLDYQDNDGDNDLDEMAFYFWLPRHHYFGENLLGVWWGRDDGDDNLLWYDVNYTYDQGLCQYRCHFSGDESFVAFGLPSDSEQWLSGWENPFLFYDPDNDGCSEVVLRIEGKGNQVRRIRYSFDVDNDAFGRRTHDYDFSITAMSATDDAVVLPEKGVTETKLRGIPTQSWLRRDHARAFIEGAPWERVLLTWDELNANTDGDVGRDPHERWEGILNHKSEHFPQVGGPACSALNKRNEVAIHPEPPLELYYDMNDHRFHLKGAREGWLDVDYDLDGRIDAEYKYMDDDEDGFWDRRLMDADADGEVDFEWPLQGRSSRPHGLDFKALNALYVPRLKSVLSHSQFFVDVAKAAMGEEGKTSDPVETFFLTRLASWMPQTGLGERIRETPAGARLYLDLLRDRLFLKMKQRFGENPNWAGVEKSYASGDYEAAARLVAEQFLPDDWSNRANEYRSFSRRLAIQLDNSGSGQRDDWPVTLSVREIKMIASDFNVRNCAVVAPDRWMDWRPIPHQVDEIDADTGLEISFLVDLPADSAETWYIYYSPGGEAAMTFPRKTGTAEDWVPPNIGWESNRCAYRAYWGQFDFFGKKTDRLIYDDIGGKSYHEEVEWGIDALHVGETSGLGGLALYRQDRSYLVQNPAGKGHVEFTKGVLCQGPVRSAIQLTAGNVVEACPEAIVRMQCLIYADRQETEIRVTVTGLEGEVLLAPGLVKLPREQFFADPSAGCFGSWGWQESVIGEIGMGLIVSPDSVVKAVDETAERRVQCRASERGQLRYWVIGDWRRGRQHPVSPTLANWRGELHVLSRLLLYDVAVDIGEAETVR